MIVQDDMFNEIINGCKSPVEEHVEKQGAKSSQIFLKGKQLQRFKFKVLPEFTKTFENQSLIKDYVQSSRESYEKLKVDEIRAAYEASVEEIKAVQDDVDEELEEIQSDKKGFASFMLNGWTIFKWVSRLIRFYAYYKKIMATFDESKAYAQYEKPKSFDWSRYDFEKEIDREEFKNNLKQSMEEWTNYGVSKFFGPLMTHTTAAILAMSDMAYHKINREIVLWIGKIILQEAIEWGIAALLSYVTGGLSLKIKQGRTAYKFKKIAQAFYNGAKRFRKIKQIKSGVYSVKRLSKINHLKKTKDIVALKKQIGNVTSVVRGVDIAYQTTMATYTIFDIFDVDREDVEEVREITRNRTKPIGDRFVAMLDIAQGFVSDDLKTGFKKLVVSAQETAKNYTQEFLKKFIDKHKSQFEIKNFFVNKEYSFDLLMQSIGQLIKIFKKDHDVLKQDYFPFEETQYGWNVKNGNKSLEFNKNHVKFADGTEMFDSYIRYGNEMTINGRTIKQITFSINPSDWLTGEDNTNIDIGYLPDGMKKKIRLRKPDGVRLKYDKNGEMRGVDIFPEIYGNGNGDVSFAQTEAERKANNWGLIGQNANVKVNYVGDAKNHVNASFSPSATQSFISIDKIKKIESWGVKDLSEITNSRNEQLKQEQEFEKKAKLLKEIIDRIVNV